MTTTDRFEAPLATEAISSEMTSDYKSRKLGEIAAANCRMGEIQGQMRELNGEYGDLKGLIYALYCDLQRAQ